MPLPQNRIKRVAAIHDLSAFGRCALTVVMPTLSAMGVQVIPLPTALMSTHTGGFDANDIYAMDLTDSMRGIYTHWEKLGIRFDAIYSGFVLNSHQCDVISDFRRRFTDENTIVLTDPVFGDDGKLYSTCTREIAEKMRELCRGSDIITPNLTEACVLCGIEYTDTSDMSKGELSAFVEKLLSGLSELNVPRIAITGIPTRKGEGLEVTTAAVDISSGKGKPFYISLPRIDAGYHGTGETFASVLLGKMLSGIEFADAVRDASEFVRDIINCSTEFPSPIREGIALEPSLAKLMKQ